MRKSSGVATQMALPSYACFALSPTFFALGTKAFSRARACVCIDGHTLLMTELQGQVCTSANSSMLTG